MLTIALAAFAGSALAGNGHGNDSQAPAAQPASSANTAPGNSANAPGQQQSDNASTHANASSHANTTSQGITANSSAGAKPSNSTPRNYSVPATSNQTKLYGNGTTAGQIALQNGYNGLIYSPGNSQPHKVVTCAHPLHGQSGGGIDVHALKSHASENACNTSVLAQPGAVLGVSLATPASAFRSGWQR